MVRYTVLSVGISAYWPFVLVFVCGLILVVIALMALLLLKDQNDYPEAWKLLHSVLNVTNQGKKKSGTAVIQKVEVQFFRIGRDAEAKKGMITLKEWISVGSGKNVDFCLDADDKKLAERHFQICINGSVLMVAPLNEETFVNGVPIRKLGTVQAYSGDLIRAGSHEYRVIFSPCDEKEIAI